MVHVETKSKYVKPSATPFKPLPKYGHLSQIDPEFAKVKDAADASIAPVWVPSLSMADFK